MEDTVTPEEILRWAGEQGLLDGDWPDEYPDVEPVPVPDYLREQILSRARSLGGNPPAPDDGGSPPLC